MDFPDGATPIDPDELLGLKFKHIETRSQLDQMEQVNIQEGLLWLMKQKNSDVLNIQFCLKLHTQLFGSVWDWAGEFRKTEKNIGIDPIYISVELRKLFDDTKAWIEYETYQPFEAALRFHHRMAYIHPFVNGNGRHARIMADTLLRVVYDSPEINWTEQNLNNISTHRKNYINALRSADAHDFEPLLSLFKLSADK